MTASRFEGSDAAQRGVSDFLLSPGRGKEGLSRFVFQRFFQRFNDGRARQFAMFADVGQRHFGIVERSRKAKTADPPSEGLQDTEDGPRNDQGLRGDAGAAEGPGGDVQPNARQAWRSAHHRARVRPWRLYIVRSHASRHRTAPPFSHLTPRRDGSALSRDHDQVCNRAGAAAVTRAAARPPRTCRRRRAGCRNRSGGRHPRYRRWCSRGLSGR